MAFVLSDRVKETTTTSGTGTLSLGGAVGAYRSFTPSAASCLLSGADLTSRLRVTGHDDLLIAGCAYKERCEHVQAVFD